MRMDVGSSVETMGARSTGKILFSSAESKEQSGRQGMKVFWMNEGKMKTSSDE